MKASRTVTIKELHVSFDNKDCETLADLTQFVISNLTSDEYGKSFLREKVLLMANTLFYLTAAGEGDKSDKT